ncbi:MAG TPA: response regulator [Candidatus Polarisedimenticolaceae bacterium]|nr:response regulator [Candidatus Polarisedimenticolaceae bacterium]
MYGPNIADAFLVVTKVLLVEDDVYNLQALTIYLRLMGLEVEPAHDGFEALKQLDNSRFHVVVSDIRMPGLDGVELVKRIRHKLKGIPIVLISGDQTATMEAIPHPELLRVLTKPFMPSELLEIIHRAVIDKEL